MEKIHKRENKKAELKKSESAAMRMKGATERKRRKTRRIKGALENGEEE